MAVLGAGTDCRVELVAQESQTGSTNGVADWSNNDGQSIDDHCPLASRAKAGDAAVVVDCQGRVRLWRASGWHPSGRRTARFDHVQRPIWSPGETARIEQAA